MTQDEINKKRDQIIKLTKYGGLALAAIVLAPLLFFTTLFLFGSVAFAGGAALLAVFFVNYLPVFGMKMANWKLKALKAEARLNPIETMQNQILKASERLEVYKQETATFIAKAKALEEDVREMRKTDPEGADGFNDVIKANAQQVVMRQDAITGKKKVAVTVTGSSLSRVPRLTRQCVVSSMSICALICVNIARFLRCWQMSLKCSLLRSNCA